MKRSIFFLLSFLSLSSFAFAGTKLHCRAVKSSLYEVFIEEGTKLSKEEIKALSSTIKRKISGAEAAYTYKMTIFRGESTPQVLQAIGATEDVLLKVFSITGPEYLSTYLDEIGPDDISSTLRVDNKSIDMGCQEK